MSEAVRLLLKGLRCVEVEESLPSYATQNTMCREMKLMACQQVAEAVRDKENLTIKYNGTTKRVGHLVETEIATKTGSLLVGLHRQSGGTANAYVESVLDSIACVEKSVPSTFSSVQITPNIVNTMITASPMMQLIGN